MSLLSAFIQTEFLKSLEAEFVAHVPEIQEVILAEMKVFASDITAWIESKISVSQEVKE